VTLRFMVLNMTPIIAASDRFKLKINR